VQASQRFKSFHRVGRTPEDFEAMNMIRKGPVKRLAGNDAQWQAMFVAALFPLGRRSRHSYLQRAGLGRDCSARRVRFMADIQLARTVVLTCSASSLNTFSGSGAKALAAEITGLFDCRTFRCHDSPSAYASRASKR
jgi:hypothetical protein